MTYVQPWLKFKEWHDHYGSDLIYLEIGSQPTFICGSVQVAWDLLEKRSNIYSSRPRFVVAGEVLSDGKRGSLAPYGPYWRNWRKALHSGFMGKIADGCASTVTAPAVLRTGTAIGRSKSLRARR